MLPSPFPFHIRLNPPFPLNPHLQSPPPPTPTITPRQTNRLHHSIHPSLLPIPKRQRHSPRNMGPEDLPRNPTEDPPPRAPLTSHSHPISKIRNPRRRRNRLRLLGCGLWVRRWGGLDEEGDRGSVEVSGKKARWMERAVEREEGEEGEHGGGGLGGWRRGLGGWGGGGGWCVCGKELSWT